MSVTQDKSPSMSLDTMNNDGKAVNVTVNSIHDGASTQEITASTSDKSWVTGWRNRFPWLGFSALCTVLLSCIGSILVLLFSDAQSATAWPDVIAPNVCLSVLQGISTLAITLAVTQGIAIAWWRKAVLGASIKELHYGWSFSTSLATILVKYKYFNVIALAALMTKVAIVDGVLFQRATGTYIAVSWNAVGQGKTGDSSVFVWGSENLPFTGIFPSDQNSVGQMNYDYSFSLIDWLAIGNGVNYNDDDTLYCYGVYCFYGLNGTGFSVDCNTTTYNDDYFLTAPKSSSNASSVSNLTVFDVNFSLLYPDTVKNYSRIGFNALWPSYTNLTQSSESPECPTSFTNYACELRPAVLNYTVYYQNASSVERSKIHDKPASSTSKGSDSSSSYLASSGSQLDQKCRFYNLDADDCGAYNASWRQAAGVKVLSNKDLYEPFVPGANSSLLGIYQTLQSVFGSKATIKYSNESWTVQQDGLLAPMQMGPIPVESSMCNYTYLSPMDTILSQLNNLMLETTVNRDLYPNDNTRYDINGNNAYNQDPQAAQFYKDRYYTTDWPYVWAALGLTIFVILCILPSYWGFWDLGREVSLGPFEIAYAFQGPAFSSVHGISGDAKQVVKNVGRTRVKYGEVEDGFGRRLAFQTT